MNKVRVGVIGTGFGKQHIGAFNAHPRSVVTAVCSAHADRAARVAAEFGVPHAYGDYQAMLAEAPIDAVAVIIPPKQHLPVVLAALDAGKHVLCTKPLAASLSEARTLYERAVASGLVHAVDHQTRFTPRALLTKQLIAEGAIGRPLSLASSVCLHMPSYLANPNASPNKFAWFTSREQAGGLFLANAPHELDRLLWQFGPVSSVSGRIHTALPEVTLPDGVVVRSDAEDSYHALLDFESGLIGLVRCTPVAWEARAGRLEVHGDAGSLLQDGASQGVKLAKPGSADYEEVPMPAHLADQGTPPKGVWPTVYILVDRFLRSVLDGEPMEPSFEAGYRTQELIEAIVLSDRTHRRQDLPLA